MSDGQVAGPGQPVLTILEDAIPGIPTHLTVGITNSDGDVVAQSNFGILEIAAPSGLYQRIPGFNAPADEGVYFITWERDGVFYADEQLIVTATDIIVDDNPTENVTLRPGLFPPGSTVDVWERTSLSGTHPPESRPRVAPLRTGVLVDAEGEIFLPTMTQNADYLVGAVVDGKWHSIDFEVSEPSNIDIETQMVTLRGQLNGEGASRVAGDSAEALARATADAALVSKDTIVVNALDHGVVGDGIANDTVALGALLDAHAGTGKVIYVPDGTYRLEGPLTVRGCTLRGEGTADLNNGTDFGSVFALQGDLETASEPVITVLSGGRVEGCTFYYPSELATNTTPQITATGAVVCLATDPTFGKRRGVCHNNYFMNVPYAIRNEQGWSIISENAICATKVAIEDTFDGAEHLFIGNNITPGVWRTMSIQSGSRNLMRAYINQNSTAFLLTSTCASFIGNQVFGYGVGVDIVGKYNFLDWNGGLIDGTRRCVIVRAAAGPGRAKFSNCTLASSISVQGSTSSYFTTLPFQHCVWTEPITNALNNGALMFSNVEFAGANVDVVKVINTGGLARIALRLVGCSINNPGRFAHSAVLALTGVTGTFQEALGDAQAGETITQAVTGATARVLRYDAPGTLYVDTITGVFDTTHVVTGATSGAHGTSSTVTPNVELWGVNYSDDTGIGKLQVIGCDFDFTGYPYSSGIVCAASETCRVIGNGWRSGLDGSGNCIRVVAATRFVEAGNTSKMSGSNADVFVAAGIQASRGPSVWARTPTWLGGEGFIEYPEQASDPSAPAAAKARVFSKDNGSGKAQLAVRFPSGATQVIATEP